MSFYEVTIEGRRFSMAIEGVLRDVGFVTTRFVDAGDPLEARRRALEILECEEKFQLLVANGGDGSLEVVNVAACMEPLGQQRRGFALYLED
jgi:hypothetical protein